MNIKLTKHIVNTTRTRRWSEQRTHLYIPVLEGGGEHQTPEDNSFHVLEKGS